MSSPFIGAYWGKRKESAEDCALRLSKLLSRMGSRHALLQGWQKKGRSKAEALGLLVQGSAEEMVELLSTNNNEVDGSAIADLGYSLNLWNGNEEHGISLNATCGAFSDYVTNSVVLQLPPGNDERVLVGVDYEAVLQDFVDTLSPDSAMLTSIDYINKNGGGAPWDSGGWINYDSRTGKIVTAKAS